MKKNLIILNWLMWTVVTLIITSHSAFAGDCPTDIVAVTSADPDVPVEVLAYRVKPLTKCELEVEAQAWLLLLKKKVTEISDASVAAIYKREEIENSKEQPGKRKKTATTDEAKEVQDASVQKIVKTVESEVNKQGGSTSGANKTTAGKEKVKAALIKHATTLAGERTILIDHFDIVLNELAAKGGKTDEYRDYIKAISSIKLNVADTSATWIAVSSWLMSAEGGIRWAVNLIQFIVTMLVFYLLSIVSGRVVKKVLVKSNKLSTLLLDFLQIGTRRLILLIGLFVGLSALEVNVGPVLAIVGAAGFVVAFALQNSLSNFASGILTLIYRPFDLGDLINVAGTLGTVETMNLLSTQLRTPDHQLVVVPNNLVWADTIINVTGIKRRRVDLIFGIGYSDDIDKAQKILEEIVAAHKQVLKNPAPIVKLHELADSSVNFICRPWVRPVDYWDVYWDVTREVKRRFDLEGVSIPFPQQDVHFYREIVAESDNK
jgi:small conductance mechanosensitive channel